MQVCSSNLPQMQASMKRMQRLWQDLLQQDLGNATTDNVTITDINGKIWFPIEDNIFLC